MCIYTAMDRWTHGASMPRQAQCPPPTHDDDSTSTSSGTAGPLLPERSQPQLRQQHYGPCLPPP